MKLTLAQWAGLYLLALLLYGILRKRNHSATPLVGGLRIAALGLLCCLVLGLLLCIFYQLFQLILTRSY